MVHASGGKSWYGDANRVMSSDYSYFGGTDGVDQSKDKPFMMVSPKVKGTVKFYVRHMNSSSASDAFLVLYKLSKDSKGNFVAGETIDVSSQFPDASTTSWAEVSVTLDEASYLGFANRYIVVSDFSAEYKYDEGEDDGGSTTEPVETTAVDICADQNYLTNFPINFCKKNSKSEIVYSSNRMASVNAGSKIHQISFEHWNWSNSSILKDVTIWMANGDDPSELTDFTDVSEMTQVYHHSDFTTPYTGDNRAKLDFPLDEAFKYTGKALYVVVECKAETAEAGAWNSGIYYFSGCARESGDFTIIKSDNDASAYASATPSVHSGVFPTTSMLVEEASATTVTGKVTDWTANGLQGAGLEGATVTFTSGDVVYTATTASDGTYSIDIAESDLSFTAKAEKEHYKTVKEKNVDLSSAVNLVTRPLAEDSYDAWPIEITQVPGHTYGYTTFYGNPYSTIYAPDGSFYSLALPDGVEAYVYGVDEGSYTLVPTKIEGIIPAGVAVVLYSEKPGEYELPEAAEEPDEEEIEAWKAKSNLNGCMGDTDTYAADGTTDGYYFYKLQYNSDDDCVGFYWGATDGAKFSSPQEKAWLYIKQDVAAKMSNFSIEEGKTTGISTLNAKESSSKGIYTVSGQKMNTASKPGLYIVDGKKLVVK